MTRMQIIAKAVLTVLGVYALVLLYRVYPGRYTYRPDETPLFLEVALLCAFTVLVGLVAYFMVFSNSQLASKLAGPGEPLDTAKKSAWLVESLRVGLVFTGLMLLPGSAPTLVKIAKTFFLIRPVFNEIIISKSIPNMLRLSYAQWYTSIYHLLEAVLTIYLICGAPHFVRWQAKHSGQETASAPTIERPENE